MTLPASIFVIWPLTSHYSWSLTTHIPVFWGVFLFVCFFLGGYKIPYNVQIYTCAEKSLWYFYCFCADYVVWVFHMYKDNSYRQKLMLCLCDFCINVILTLSQGFEYRRRVTDRVVMVFSQFFLGLICTLLNKLQFDMVTYCSTSYFLKQVNQLLK